MSKLETDLSGLLKEIGQQISTWPSLSPQEKTKVLMVAEEAKKLADTVRELAKQDAMNGERFVDLENQIQYGLQYRPGRLVLDTRKTWEAAKECGVPIEAFLASSFIYPGKAEQLLSLFGMGKDAAKALVEKCGTRGEGVIAFVRKSIKYTIR